MARPAAPTVPLTDAQKAFAEQNLPLVYWVIHNYGAATVARFGMDAVTSDLSLTLLRAAQGFDPAKSKFATYAVWALRYELFRMQATHDRRYGRGTRRLPRTVLATDLNAVGDTYCDPAVENTHIYANDDGTHLHKVRARVAAELSGLDDWSRKAVALRFGLGGGEPMTFEQIGKAFGVSKQGAQKICRHALAALRPRLKALDPCA